MARQLPLALWLLWPAALAAAPVPAPPAAARKPLTESSGALAIEIGRRLGMKPEAIYATLAEFSAR